MLATLEHPAMLQYLDNSQNAAGHINENYARELMELHTLGVNGGYSQQDVQQLARILTGAGVNAGASPHLKPEWLALYNEEVPVIAIDGRKAFKYQVDVDEFLKRLAARA